MSEFPEREAGYQPPVIDSVVEIRGELMPCYFSDGSVPGG